LPSSREQNETTLRHWSLQQGAGGYRGNGILLELLFDNCAFASSNGRNEEDRIEKCCFESGESLGDDICLGEIAKIQLQLLRAVRSKGDPSQIGQGTSGSEGERKSKSSGRRRRLIEFFPLLPFISTFLSAREPRKLRGEVVSRGE